MSDPIPSETTVTPLTDSASAAASQIGSPVELAEGEVLRIELYEEAPIIQTEVVVREKAKIPEGALYKSEPS